MRSTKELLVSPRRRPGVDVERSGQGLFTWAASPRGEQVTWPKEFESARWIHRSGNISKPHLPEERRRRALVRLVGDCVLQNPRGAVITESWHKECTCHASRGSKLRRGCDLGFAIAAQEANCDRGNGTLEPRAAVLAIETHATWLNLAF